MRKTITGAVLAAIMVHAGAANAVEPNVACQAGKLKVSSSYAACRLKAEAVAVAKGVTPDYSKCETKFNEKFAGAETKADDMCQTKNDIDEIKSLIDGCDGAIAKSLSDGSVIQDPVSCAEDLEVCEAFNCGVSGIFGTWTLYLPDAVQGSVVVPDTCTMKFTGEPSSFVTDIYSCGYLGGAHAPGNFVGENANSVQVSSPICSGFDLYATMTFSSCNAGSGTYTCRSGPVTIFSGTFTASR